MSVRKEADHWLYCEIGATEVVLERMESLGPAALPHQQDERDRIIHGYREKLAIFRHLRALNEEV